MVAQQTVAVLNTDAGGTEGMHDDFALGLIGFGVDLRRGRGDKKAREGAGEEEEVVGVFHTLLDLAARGRFFD
jgi:hypothetical protein